MARQIEKTEEGLLTTEQSQEFMEIVAGLNVLAFQKLGKLNATELLAVFQAKKDGQDVYMEIINSIFQDVVDADLPQAFNDYLQNVGSTVLEKTFNAIAQKHNDNLASLVEEVTGIPYNDLSPKDVIDTINARKVE